MKRLLLLLALVSLLAPAVSADEGRVTGLAVVQEWLTEIWDGLAGFVVPTGSADERSVSFQPEGVNGFVVPTGEAPDQPDGVGGFVIPDGGSPQDEANGYIVPDGESESVNGFIVPNG